MKQSLMNKEILSLQFAIQVLCCLAWVILYSHQEELFFWFCFCVNEIDGFLDRLTTCRAEFKEAVVDVGLVLCLADGSTMNTSSGLSNHLSSCSRHNAPLTALRYGFSGAAFICQHMRWEGKNSICVDNGFHPSVSMCLIVWGGGLLCTRMAEE